MERGVLKKHVIQIKWWHFWWKESKKERFVVDDDFNGGSWMNDVDEDDGWQTRNVLGERSGLIDPNFFIMILSSMIGWLASTGDYDDDDDDGGGGGGCKYFPEAEKNK